VVPQDRRKVLDALSVLSGESERSGVGPRVRLLLDDMLDQWRGLDRRIPALDDEFAEMARNNPAARRLATVPGVGVLNAARAGCRDRRWPHLQPGARSLGLAGAGAASSNDGRQAKAARDH
jgi:transposase